MTLSAPSITADGRSTSTATMTLTDANGNPVSGDAVTLMSSDLNQPVGAVTAGAKPGTYQATITSTTTAGTATITGTDSSVNPIISATATLTQAPDTATFVAIALSSPSITADGGSTSVATATVTDLNGNGVAGDSVAITGSGTQPIGAVTAGLAPGTYQATITATLVSGSATITAADTTPARQVSGAATLTQTAGPAAVPSARLYWPGGNGQAIGRGNLNGSGAISAFIAGAGHPSAIAVDGTFVYWADNGLDSIGRANLDGTGANQSFIPGASNPLGVAVDGSYVYWTNRDTNMIGRANLDGSNADQYWMGAGNLPVAVAVDGSYVYWTSIPGDIGRASLDGTGANQNFITGANYPLGLAVDASHVYWSNSHRQAIGRANLDGSGVDQSFITGASVPAGLTVDGSYVYWANNATGTIGRANLDGSGASQNFISGLGDPQGVAVSAVPPTPQVTLSAASITADGRSTSTATMTVTDANGNPVSGDSVAITSSDAGQPVGLVTAGPGPGTYQATITATTTSGSATITATDSSVTPNISETATLIQTPDRATDVTVALSPQTITADGSSTTTATATVTDQNGNPAIGDDVAITSSDPGQPIGQVTAGPSPGTYRATVTATTAAGSATITATDTTVAHRPSGASTLIQNAGPATRLAIAFNAPSLPADGSASTTATATVTDANGNPVSGDMVAITSSGAQPVGPGTAGASPGTYTATITATTLAGSATITATDNSVLPPVTAGATLTQTDPGVPTAQITTPLDGGIYLQHQVLGAVYACSDAASQADLSSCAGPVASGSPLDTASVGSHVFTVTAADRAGTTSHTTVTYNVIAAPDAQTQAVIYLTGLAEWHAGQVTVPFGCAAGGAACRGTMALTIATTREVGQGRHRHILTATAIVGKVKYSLAVGGHRQIKLALNGMGRRLYRTHKLGHRIKVAIAPRTGGPLIITVNAPR